MGKKHKTMSSGDSQAHTTDDAAYPIFVKTRTDIETTEKKFDMAFHSSSVIMVIFTLKEGLILEANDAALKMTGYSSDEIIGQTIPGLNLYPVKKQRKKVRDLLLEQGGIQNYEIKVRTKSGENRYGLFSMDPLYIDGTLCVFAVGTDFSQRKKAEDKLKQAYIEQGRQKKVIEAKSRELTQAKRIIEEEARLVEEASRHKSEFIASMSHELRTPLNSIILLSDLLAQNRNKGLTGKEVEYASIIKSAGRDLLKLINDVLDISRVESGRMEINLSNVSTEYLCRKINGYFTEMAEVKGLEFSINCESGLKDTIYTDIQKLEQILKNLVSNAIKFTEKGSVTLDINRPDPSADLTMIGLCGLEHDKTLAFSVKDTGIGIPHDKKDYIFEYYRQADKNILKNFGGTGLGLPVSRVMAQLLGGDIHVQSHFGKGSAFTLYIPEVKDPKAILGKAVIGDDHEISDELNETVSRLLSGEKILIADDDMRTAYSMIQYFENYNPEIIVAQDGRKCLEKLEENPDMKLIILDIAMPELTGLQVLEKIRKNGRFKHTPVIVVTAKAMKGDREICLVKGADAYLTKPVDIESILTTIIRVLSPSLQ